MKRIVIDARMIQMSGIGRYLRSVLPAVLSIPDTETILMGDPSQLEKWNTSVIPFQVRIYHPREQIEFKRKIPPCDLFWSPHFNVPVGRIPARKRLATIHDVFHLSPLSPYNWLEKAYARFLLKRALRLSDTLIVPSDFTRDEIDFYLHPKPDQQEKIRIIYHYAEGVEETSTEEQQRTLAQYGITSPFVLYVGNIKPHKNITGLLQAFAIVSRLTRDLNLVIVGNKVNFYKGIPEFEGMLARHDLFSRVIFTGKVGDCELSVLYRNACMLVLPSFYEGFGLPPLEAMSVGCPVVLSYIPVFYEIFGEAALYTNPYSPQDIAEKIYTLFCSKELRETYRQRGRERASFFTREKTLAAHRECIVLLLH